MDYLTYTIISTLRFLALPLALAFEAIGLPAPQPTALILAGGIPRPDRYLTTVSARCAESSQ